MAMMLRFDRIFTTLKQGAAAAVFLVVVTGPEALAKRVEEQRELPGFTRVKASGSSDVEIKVGPAQSVVVHAADDEIDQIKTEVSKGELKIWREKGGRRFGNHHATIVITVPQLTRLVSQGSGDASIENIKAKKFKLVQQGSGDVEISGSCGTLDLVSQGSGDLESQQLACDEINATLRGSGDMELDAVSSKHFMLDAVGSGDVTLKGYCETFDLEHRASGDVDGRSFKCENAHVRAAGSGDMRVHATVDVTINIHGSGDVEVYGGGKAGEISASGSGSVHVRE